MIVWHFFLVSERFVFKYYANGYNYIIPKLDLNWIDSRKYCLSMGTDLPILLEKDTELTINEMLTRAGVSQMINLGLRRHPVTSELEWVDGSPLEYTNWHSNKPDTGECTSRFNNKEWDSLNCVGHLRPVMCQQPVEGTDIVSFRAVTRSLIGGLSSYIRVLSD